MPRRPNEKLPTNPSDLDGPTKAAILLLALGHDDASLILKEMPSETVEELMRELASLGRVTGQLQSAVVPAKFDKQRCCALLQGRVCIRVMQVVEATLCSSKAFGDDVTQRRGPE